MAKSRAAADNGGGDGAAEGRKPPITVRARPGLTVDVLKPAALFPGPSARNEKAFMFCGGGEHNLS